MALNPALDVSQYAHTSWTVRDGFFKASINAVAQSTDGYLWVGTEFRLVRFDGVRLAPWAPPTGEHLPHTQILRLLAARDGRLWIGTAAGLASWKDGKLTHYPELDGQWVWTLLEDHLGTIWAGGVAAAAGRLCAIHNSTVHCYGNNGSFGAGVLSLYEYRGVLWAGAATGLWRWKPDPPSRYPLPGPFVEPHDMIQGDNGALWIATPGGITQFLDGKAEPYPLPWGAHFNPVRLLRDREGALWIGTNSGILHLHQGRTDLFASADGLSDDSVHGLFEDHEGNIWAATTGGLDRFREFAVSTISVKEGLSSAVAGSVLAARDGSVWLGTLDGLNRRNHGQITIYRKGNGLPDDTLESLGEDNQGRIWVSTVRGVAYFENGRFTPVRSVPSRIVRSIAQEGAGNLWISDLRQGLFHLRDGRFVERIPWARLAARGNSEIAAPKHVTSGMF